MEQDNNLKLQFSLINIFVLFLFAVVVGVISSLTTYSLLSPKLFNQLPSETQSSAIPQTQPSELEGKPNVLPTSSAVDETAGWKVYKDKRYGYEFQYPKNWNLAGDKNNSDTNSYNVTIWEGNGFNKDNIQIVNVSSSYGINADGSIHDRNAVLKNLNNGEYSKISIVGGEGYYNINETKGGPSPTIYLVGEKEIFLMGFNIYDSSLAEAEKLFKQIIGTFKFKK